jgi:hypothetical protein
MHKLTIRIDGEGFALSFHTQQQVAEALANFTRLVTTHGHTKAMIGMREAIKIREAMVPAAPARGIHLG